MEKQIELFGDDEATDEKMEEILRDAVAAGRVPIECIDEIEISETHYARVVTYHET